MPRRGSEEGGGWGDRGFPGSANPQSPSLLPEASLPEAPSPSVRAGVSPREGCGAPVRPVAFAPGRAGTEHHTSARSPQTPRNRSPPPPPACPGRDRPEGLAHLNLDLPRGTGAASPERAFSSAPATAGWGERARRELQQVSLAQPSVPCPGTAVICAPHRTQLGSSPSFPPRPALSAARPVLARRPRPRVLSPTPARSWSRWTDILTCAEGWAGPRGPEERRFAPTSTLSTFPLRFLGGSPAF